MTVKTLGFEIDYNASFLDLNEAIQDAVDFDNDHLFEFYVGHNQNNSEIEQN